MSLISRLLGRKDTRVENSSAHEERIQEKEIVQPIVAPVVIPTITPEETIKYWKARASDMSTSEGKVLLLQRLRESEFVQKGIQTSKAKSALEYAILSFSPRFASADKNLAYNMFEIEVYTSHNDLQGFRDKVIADWKKTTGQYKNDAEWNLLIVIPYGLAIGRELPVSIKRLNYCLLYGRIREIST